MPAPSSPGGGDRCPRCDTRFGCAIATGGCWCSRVKLTDEQRTQLAAGYEGCLCPSCLRELSTAGTRTARGS